MAHQIVWTNQVLDTYKSVILYLEENWSEKEVRVFEKAVEKKLTLIKTFPLMYRQSKKKSIHEVLVTRQNLMFYRVRQNYMEVLLFWDRRQNP